MRSVFVTGDRGFIGKRLCRKLGEAGFQVKTLPSDIDLAVLPIEDFPSGRIDVIVHLAALLPGGGIDPFRLYLNNFRVTINLIEMMVKRGIPRIIYANTYGYGKPEYLPVDENHPVVPSSPYHSSKYLGERLLFDFSRLHGLQTVSLRIFNAYGPGQKGDFLVPSVLSDILAGRDVVIRDGRSRRDYVFVDDVADAFIRGCRWRRKENAFFNIGSGQSHSNRVVAEKLIALSGKCVKLIDRGVSRPGEIGDCVADISRAKRDLHWEPVFDIDAGLKQTVLESLAERPR